MSTAVGVVIGFGLLVATLILMLGTPPAVASPLVCTGDAQTPRRLELIVRGEPAYGLFVAPLAPPTAVVVLAHGYSFNAEGWRDHARRVAQRTGALAVAMNYRGLIDLPDDPSDAWPYPRSRGYPVKKGGEDLVAAAQQALGTCATIESVVLLGVSMGGNAASLAVANRGTRADGRPLFDYFIGVEGAYDTRALYQVARLFSPFDEFAANVRADMEAETGGTPESAPAAYAERTSVDRAGDIAASGLKGAIVVHGLEDGLAFYPQAEQFNGELRRRGVTTDLYRVGSRGPDDDPDTTLLGPAGVQTGIAGHATEVSDNHVVIDTGFARLRALLAGAPPPCGRDFFVNGNPTTTFAPDPQATTQSCPRGRILSQPGKACPPPRLRTLLATRSGRDIVVRGRVRRTACAGVARGPLTLRLTAERRTRVVRMRAAGRFAVRLRRAAGARRVTVSVRDELGRSSATVRVRQRKV